MARRRKAKGARARFALDFRTPMEKRTDARAAALGICQCDDCANAFYGSRIGAEADDGRRMALIAAAEAELTAPERGAILIREMAMTALA